MKCTICKTGELKPGHTTVVLERDGATIVLKEFPADSCDNCGEYICVRIRSSKIAA